MERKAHRRLHRLRCLLPPVEPFEIEVPESASTPVTEEPAWEAAPAGPDEVQREAPQTSSIPPAAESSVRDDTLPIYHLLQAYNASLRRAQEAELGWYELRGIEHNVFFDEEGCKNVVTRPREMGSDRVSHLVLLPGGTIVRIVYERQAGPPDRTDLLFEDGLASLLEEPIRLRRFPGYRLRTTAYDREGDCLVAVERQSAHYDPERQEMIWVPHS